jgi:endonuclease/exonuclease/phosphatase family metal-dependent hydrolase
MKIVSFNIGNFVWVLYTQRAPHYAFQRKDTEAIVSLITAENADVIFLQEIATHEDADILREYFPNFSFSLKIQTETHALSLFLSKHKIEEVHHTYSNDYHINGITFFPIHLYAFSSKVRSVQTNLLLPDLPKEKGVILGDTNFWIYNDFFFSKRDKSSYHNITKTYTDCLHNLGETCRIKLSLDKIFITKDLQSKDSKIVKHRIGSVDHYLITTTISTKDNAAG